MFETYTFDNEYQLCASKNMLSDMFGEMFGMKFDDIAIIISDYFIQFEITFSDSSLASNVSHNIITVNPTSMSLFSDISDTIFDLCAFFNEYMLRIGNVQHMMFPTSFSYACNVFHNYFSSNVDFLLYKYDDSLDLYVQHYKLSVLKDDLEKLTNFIHTVHLLYGKFSTK